MCKADKRRCAKSQTIRRSNVLLKIRNLIFPKKELMLGGALALALVACSAPLALAEDQNLGNQEITEYTPFTDPGVNVYGGSISIKQYKDGDNKWHRGVLHTENANSLQINKLTMSNGGWLYVNSKETNISSVKGTGNSAVFIDQGTARLNSVDLNYSDVYALGANLSFDALKAENVSYVVVLGDRNAVFEYDSNNDVSSADWSTQQDTQATVDFFGDASFANRSLGMFNAATHVTFAENADLTITNGSEAYLLGKNDFQGNNQITVDHSWLYVNTDYAGADSQDVTEYGNNVSLHINTLGDVYGTASNLNVDTTFTGSEANLNLQRNNLSVKSKGASEDASVDVINENLFIPDPNGENDVTLTWEGRIKSIDDAYYGSADSPSQVFNKSLKSSNDGDGNIFLRTYETGSMGNSVPGEKLGANTYVVVFDDPNKDKNFTEFSGTVDVETGVFTVNGDTVFGDKDSTSSVFNLSAQNLVQIQEKVGVGAQKTDEDGNPVYNSVGELVYEEGDPIITGGFLDPEYMKEKNIDERFSEAHYYDVDKEGTLAFRRGENAENGATLNFNEINIGTDRTLTDVDKYKKDYYFDADGNQVKPYYTLYVDEDGNGADVKTNGANVWIDTRGAGTDANLGAINANTLTIANDTNFWLDDISTKKSDNSLTFGLNVTDGKVTMKTYTEYENYKTYIDKTPFPDRSTGKDENGKIIHTEDFNKYAAEYGAVRAVDNELADADKTPDANGYYATAGWFNQELDLSDANQVNTFLDHTFGQAALVNATYDDASKTVTINAKNMLDFANEPGRNVNGNDIKYAKGMDEMRVFATTDDKYYKMYEALWNEKDPYKVEQALKNLAGLNYMMLNSYSHYGSITSSFFGGSTTSGLQRRGQSAHERMDEPLQESAISQPEQEDDLKRAIWASYVYATVNGYDYMEGGSKITGYDMRRQGIIGGIRKQFNGSTSGGLFFGLTNPQADARDSFASGEGTFRTKMEMDDFQFAGHMEKTFFDTMELSVFVGGGHQSMDWNRWVNHNAAGLYSFTSDGTGNTMTGTLYLAQRIDLNENWKLRPLIGIDSEHSWIYGYDEREGARGNDKKLGLSTTAMLTDPFHYSNVYYNRNTGRVGATISYSSPDENAGISGRISYGTQLGGKPAPIYNVKSLRSALELNDLEGHKMGTDSFSAGAGGFINLNPAKTLTASGEINGIWYKNATTLNATGGLYYRF